MCNQTCFSVDTFTFLYMMMMMMMMMTMMTNIIPYWRTKTHIWEKVLMGIWASAPMTTRTTMTVTQSVCKICRYRSSGAAIKNDVSKSYVITFEAMHVPKCWEKHLSVSNKTHVKIWPSVLGISDPIMDLEALIVWRLRWSVRDQKEILGKKIFNCREKQNKA